MEIHTSEFTPHTRELSGILAEVCLIAAGGHLLSISNEAGTRVIGIGVSGSVLHQQYREVVSDLGRRETVLGLPIPSGNRPRYWIGLHEIWRPLKKKLTFVSCGLRLYMGFPEEDIAQIVRLEWVAPQRIDKDTMRYDGGHAGHPHWHIDQFALKGDDEYRQSLDLLTAPSSELPVENFEPDNNFRNIPPRQVHDCSWIQNMHFPAHASWMNLAWDGATLPGPHQSEPQSLLALSHWWKGAIRYLAAELRTHAAQ